MDLQNSHLSQVAPVQEILGQLLLAAQFSNFELLEKKKRKSSIVNEERTQKNPPNCGEEFELLEKKKEIRHLKRRKDAEKSDKLW